MKTIAVLGGGSAGFTAARIASKNGARVLFFMGDKADHASLCINAGCMPSKALFEPIDAMHHAKQRGWLEVTPKQPDEYLAQIVRWKDHEIASFRAYREKEIRELQKKRFGYEGDLFKERQKLVKPLQDRVYNAVQKLAVARSYDFILDKSEGITVIFADPKLDKSEDVLKELGIR